MWETGGWNYLRLSGEEIDCWVVADDPLELSPPERRREEEQLTIPEHTGIISA